MPIFHSFLYVYQRLNLHFPMVFLWFSLLGEECHLHHPTSSTASSPAALRPAPPAALAAGSAAATFRPLTPALLWDPWRHFWDEMNGGWTDGYLVDISFIIVIYIYIDWDVLSEDFYLLMTPQNQGFSSNKTLPKITCPKTDPVISRFQEFGKSGGIVNLLLTGQSQKVDCFFF